LLIAVRQRDGVPVVPVGDQQALLEEGRGQGVVLWVRCRHPEPMPGPRSVGDVERRVGGHGLAEVFGEPLHRPSGHGVDGRQVRPDVAEQAEPILQRAGHGPFVPEDRTSPLLQLDFRDQAPDPSISARIMESKLVGEERRVIRGPKDPRPAPGS
jgi:hypothetical protein